MGPVVSAGQAIESSKFGRTNPLATAKPYRYGCARDGRRGVLRLLSLLALGVTISACASDNYEVSAEVRKAEWEAKNLYPRTYRAEIVAYLRTYLNDPSGLREAAISAPVL